MSPARTVFAVLALTAVLASCTEVSQPTDIDVGPLFGLAKGITKVTICHKGRPITVGEPAVAAHLAHGDVEGPCGGGSVLFTEDFNGYVPGSTGTQFETGLALGVFGSVPGWTGGGINHSHAVDLDPGPGTDWALQFAGGTTAALGNTLTLDAGIPANDAGVLYQVSFDAAPTVWQVGSQITRAVDGVRIDILRSDNSVLASFLHQPGAWPGGPDAQNSFNRASFTYTGDGTGDVRIHMVIDPPAVPHFGGAIDNLRLEN